MTRPQINPSWFCEKLGDDFVCCLCSCVMDEPRTCMQCATSFCRLCLDQLPTKACPNCLKVFTSSDMVVAPLIERQIGALKMRCKHDDCKVAPFTTGRQFVHFFEHLRTCDYESTACSLCSTSLIRHQLKSHSDACPEVEIRCESCGDAMKRKKLEEHVRASQGLSCAGLMYCPNACAWASASTTNTTTSTTATATTAAATPASAPAPPTSSSAPAPAASSPSVSSPASSTTIIRRKDLQSHLLVCPNKGSQCEVCGANVLQNAMEKHMMENAVAHIQTLITTIKFQDSRIFSLESNLHLLAQHMDRVTVAMTTLGFVIPALELKTVWVQPSSTPSVVNRALARAPSSAPSSSSASSSSSSSASSSSSSSAAAAASASSQLSTDGTVVVNDKDASKSSALEVKSSSSSTTSFTGVFTHQIGSKTADRFKTPALLASSKSNELFIAGGGNAVVDVYSNPSSSAFTKLRISIGGYRKGSDNGEFLSPGGVCAWGEEVFVSDADRQDVQVFDLQTGKFLRKFGGKVLSWPKGLTVVNDTEVWVVENDKHKVFIFEKDTGKHIRTMGSSQGTGDNEFNCPYDICVGGEEVFITDSANKRIQVFNFKGQFLRRVPTAYKFNYPRGISYHEGVLFVTDYKPDVCVALDAVSGLTIKKVESEFNLPIGSAVVQGQLFVADSGNNCIKAFT